MSETQTTEIPPLAEAMTARDLRTHLDAMQATLGAKGHISIFCVDWGAAAYVGLYENWPLDDPTSFRAATWPEAITAAQQWIANHVIVRRDTLIRRMALAVIDLTDQHGRCDADALERAGFARADIAEHGVAACGRADEMAGNGPFEIVGTHP